MAKARLVARDIPMAPDSPKATDVSDTEILLRWKVPRQDGNTRPSFVTVSSRRKRLPTIGRTWPKMPTTNSSWCATSSPTPTISSVWRPAPSLAGRTRGDIVSYSLIFSSQTSQFIANFFLRNFFSKWFTISLYLLCCLQLDYNLSNVP